MIVEVFDICFTFQRKITEENPDNFVICAMPKNTKFVTFYSLALYSKFRKKYVIATAGDNIKLQDHQIQYYQKSNNIMSVFNYNNLIHLRSIILHITGNRIKTFTEIAKKLFNTGSQEDMIQF